MDSNRYMRAVANDMGQDLHMLHSKIRKSIYIEGVILRKIAVAKFAVQPIHLISWIPFSLRSNAVIGFIK